MTGLASLKVAPDQKTYSEVSMKVDAARCEYSNRLISIFEFGTAKPLRQVTLSAEVQGRITFMKSGLKSGVSVTRGEILVEIDHVDYKISLTKAQAEFARLEADVRHSELSHTSEVTRLTALDKDYSIAEKTFKRQQKLFQQDAVSETVVDRAEQEAAQKKSLFLSLKNSVELFPYQIKALKSQLASSRASVEQAQITLDRCTIKAPFTGRLSGVAIEENQYVKQGDGLVTIADESRLEIPVSIPGPAALKMGLSTGRTESDRYRLVGAENISAQISWVESSGRESVSGTVVRVEGYSSELRTVQLVIQPNKHSAVQPLVSGMFCRVELTSKLPQNLIAIPREAIQFGGKIFSIDGESRVHQRTIDIYHRDEAVVYLVDGIDDGELIVTSKLPFDLINGMKVVVSNKESIR